MPKDPWEEEQGDMRGDREGHTKSHMRRSMKRHIWRNDLEEMWKGTLLGIQLEMHSWEVVVHVGGDMALRVLGLWQSMLG